MADKRMLLPMIALALLLAATNDLTAQETPADAAPSTGTAETPEAQGGVTFVPDYFFEYQEDGTPLFRQVISWREIPNCLAYEVILEDSEGTELVRERTEDTSVTISLPPGEYRYSIVIYNLLDKPELQTEWLPIVIVKAEIPEIEELSPNAIYMEEAKFQVTIRGINLLSDAEFSLVDQTSGNEVLSVDKITAEDDETIVLFLPDRKIDFGDYLVKVVNPGGISDVSETGFVVRYQKPVDFYASLGYAPHIPLYDDYFVANWSKPVYATGAVARVGLLVLKRRWGYIGPEISGHFIMMKGGISEATITSQYLRLGLNGVYKYLFTPKFHGIIRIGGGIALNVHGFDYEGTEGPEMTSADFFLSAGLSLQYHFTKRVYAEIGGDWSHIFHKTYSEGNVAPEISVGYSY